MTMLSSQKVQIIDFWKSSWKVWEMHFMLGNSQDLILKNLNFFTQEETLIKKSKRKKKRKKKNIILGSRPWLDVFV